jgi:serine/threonine-protein kinase
MVSENQLQVEDVLGGFKIEKELGRGGMGVVFKAHELSLNRKIALKVLSSRLSSNEEFIRRFKREARVIATLRHPNIVNVLSYGEERGLHYFAMEYVPGKDLGKILKERRLIPCEEALNIVRQVADAIGEAALKGVVHRDIKPSNIMIDSMNRAYVTDFGVAHFAESSEKLTQTGLFLGTPEYASPEQALGKPLDTRSDIYSLGAVLYRMISGQVPVTAESPIAVVAKISAEPVPPISQINPSVPAPICHLIDKMMAKDINQRYQSSEELIRDIDQCIQMTRMKVTPIAAAKNNEEKETAGTLKIPPQKSNVRAIGSILGIALAVVLIVWIVEGSGLLTNSGNDSTQKKPVEPKQENTVKSDSSVSDEKTMLNQKPATITVPEASVPVEKTKPPVEPKPSPIVEPEPIDQKPEQPILKTEEKEKAPVTNTLARVDRTPPLLPKIPTVLVIVSGDEILLPSARSYLYSAITNRGLPVLTFSEIPLLKNKMQWGSTPLSWYDIRQFIPPQKAQILILGEITKIGSIPIQYYGRSDNLTIASFSFQTIDMETGGLIYSNTSESIRFSPLNMDSKLKTGINTATKEIKTEILNYWSEKMAS